MVQLKQRAYAFCEEYINARLQRLSAQMKALKSGLGTETKSSAGDKHETGRAMLQLEMEKLGQQLLEAEKLLQVLQQVPKDSKNGKAVLGSLVTTDKQGYYLGISAGKYEEGDTVVFCISVSTPIGQLLLGKEKGDHFTFNGVQQNIITVV